MADNTILAKLDGIREKYAAISEQITDPAVMNDMKRYIQLNKEYKELGPIVEAADRYRTAVANLQEAKDILVNEKDEEMREMARGEVETLEPAIEQLEEDIKLMLIPADPQDGKNAIMEIRGGPEGMRLRYSLETCCGCISSSSSGGGGRPKSTARARGLRGGTRRWY